MTSTFRQLTRKHAEIGIILISLALIAVFAATSADKWANAYNLASIAQVTATLGIMALGVSLVIGTGEIDISVGSVFGVGAIIYLALVMSTGPVPAVLVAVAAGALVGALNGYLVAFFRAPSLIITLSTLLVFRGFAIGLTEGFSFSDPMISAPACSTRLSVAATFWASTPPSGGSFSQSSHSPSSSLPRQAATGCWRSADRRPALTLAGCASVG
jgi:ribose/xylose/arabinose/galactoside ABC-type transport system permease subunit